MDALVRARLKPEGLDLQPRADRHTLLRRLSLDLTGVPPTPQEVAAFENDADPGALTRVVDRLLASPRFGERMAWDWLDAARYADSNGYQGDLERSMWPWRDWVVDAWNRNLPYDQFTQWQLAGDLLPNPTQQQVLATGFLRNHPINGEGGRIAEENRVDYVMDMLETTGTVWLGLTFNCCRCHDHKYDPLLQSDYYSFFAFFNQTPVKGDGGDPQSAPRIDLPQPEEKAAIQKAQGELKQAEAEVAALWKASEGPRAAWIASSIQKAAESAASKGQAPSKPKPNDLQTVLQTPENAWKPDQRKVVEESWAKEDAAFGKALEERNKKRGSVDAAQKGVTRVMVMADQKNPRPTFILDRGLYSAPGMEVKPGVPHSLPPLAEGAPANRLGLARWLTGSENPLMARVTVNRFWQMLFGIGLVKTSEDFGVQAETPLHRDLLDWLAAEFRDSGWDVKALLRLIVTSETYLQSSKVPPALAERDPQNRLLARGPRFRMPSWMIRDQALAASGLLVEKRGGKPVHPYQPEGVWEEATFGNKKYKQDEGESLYRRSLYTFWRRIVGPTMFFDTTNRTTCTVKPLRTNTPLHALSTLNDPTYVEAARTLAQSVLREPNATPESRIQEMYRRILAREPSREELQIWIPGLNRHLQRAEANPKAARELLQVGSSPRDPSIPETEHAAYTALCLSILNLDETLTKE